MSRFLLVDEDPATLAPLAIFLEKAGHAVSRASTGFEALDEARVSPPDLILSDVLMPDMDGFALCRAWSEVETLRAIPFVFYTGTYVEPEDEALGLELGADLFLRKPMPLKKITTVLEAAAAERTAQLSPPRPSTSEVEAREMKEHDSSLIQRLEARALELRRSNQALAHDLSDREGLLQLVIDSVPTGLAYLDRRLHIEQANERFWSILGHEPADPPARDLSTVLGRETHQRLEPACHAALAGHAGRVEIPHHASDGASRVLEILLSPQISDGHTLGLVLLASDISAQREAEEVLEQYRERIEIRVQERTLELRNANRQLRRQVAERLRVEEALSSKSLALQEVLDTVQSQKRDQSVRFAQNVERQVLPLLQILEDMILPEHRVLVTQIRTSLDEITTTTGDRLAHLLGKLTPTEVRMVNHIRRGLAVKEIARLERLSPATISRHRHNIRRKLGLLGRKVNLESFLIAEFSGAPDD